MEQHFAIVTKGDFDYYAKPEYLNKEQYESLLPLINEFLKSTGFEKFEVDNVEEELKNSVLEQSMRIDEIAESYNKNGEVNEIEVLTEDEYLSKNGASFMGGSEPALHKNIQEGSGKQQAIKKVQEDMRKNNERREELRKEYQDKVVKGELRPINKKRKNV